MKQMGNLNLNLLQGTIILRMYVQTSIAGYIVTLYLPADGTLDRPVDVRAMYATGAEGMEAGEQAGLVVVIVADTAGEGIPGSATRHARCAVIADPVDRRARARHRRRHSATLSRAVNDARADDTRLPPHFTTPLPVPCSCTPLQKRTEAIYRDAARA